MGEYADEALAHHHPEVFGDGRPRARRRTQPLAANPKLKEKTNVTITAPTAAPKMPAALPFAHLLQSGPQATAPKSHLIYGYPGRWKTSIGLSILKVDGFSTAFMLDIDNGSEVLGSDPVYQQAYDEGRLQILTIDPLAENAKEMVDAVIMELTTKDYGFDAFIWDTLDVSQDAAEKQIKKHFKGFDVWNEVGEWTADHMWRLHNCRHLVGITLAHVKEYTNKEDGTNRLLPKLSGSSREGIGGIPSTIAYVDFQTNPNDNTRHLVARMGEEAETIGKNRFRIDPFIIDFDMPKLYENIASKRAELGITKPIFDPTALAAATPAQ